MKTTTLAAILILSNIYLRAQNLPEKPFLKFTNISNKLGIPGEFARCIFQDDQGLIWFGSENSFKYYDGYTYKEYFLEENDIWVTAITQDHKGNIWAFAGADVLYHLNRKTDRITRHILIEDNLVGTLAIYGYTPFSRCLFEDSNQNLWVSTYKGFKKYDPDSNTFIDIEGEQDGYRGWIYEDTNGLLWEVLNHGIRRFNSSEELYISFINSEGHEVKIDNIFNNIIYDNSGNLWISAQTSGLLNIDLPSGILTTYTHSPNDPYSLGFNWVNHVLEDSQERIWVAVDDGLDLFNPTIDGFIHYPINFQDPNAISGKTLYLFEDKYQGLWVSQYHGGIIHAGKATKAFKIYRGTTGNPFGLSDSYISNFFERPDGKIWISTDGNGVNLLNRENDTFTHYTPTSDAPKKINCFKCFSVFEDTLGYIWVRSSNGIERLNLSSGEIDSYLLGGLYFDNDNQVWVTRKEGVSKFNFSKKSFEIVLPEVYAIFQDPHNEFWIATTEGICKYDFNTSERKDCFTTNAYALLPDSKNNFWMLLPTQGDTLIKYDTQLNQFTDTVLIPNVKDHMYNRMVIDNNDHIWIGTNNGIFRYEPENRVFTHFDYLDGLGSSYFRLCNPYKTRAGELIFGSTKGFIIFHPDSIKANDVKPPVIITDFSINNISLPVSGSVKDTMTYESPLKKHIHFTDSLTLSHFQNDISISFSALNFTHSEKNQFKYKLIGYDKEWIQSSSSQRTAKYTNLAPGPYTFHVIAANNDRVWNDIGKTLFIKILPPWYWSWWSKALYTLLILLGIYLFIRWRTASQQKKLQEAQKLNGHLQRVDQLKDQFLANTSHELRTPIQGIIGLSEAVLDRSGSQVDKEDLSMIISSGKRLNNLINDILDFSKLKNHDIQLIKKPIDLVPLVDIILKNNAPLIKGKDLSLINAIPPNTRPVLADENRLQQVLYNLIGNAIKFTESGEIIVGVGDQKLLARSLEGNSTQLVTANSSLPKVNLNGPGILTLFIQDSGIGIPENKREAIFQEFEQADGSISREFAGTGLGLSISKRIIELHGGELWVVSEVGEGSTFFFSLPISDKKPSTIQTDVLIPLKQGITISSPKAAKQDEIFMSNTSNDSERGSVNILVVDDEPINQQVLKNHLQGKGFSLIQAMNGQEALSFIEIHSPFDLVLLDVMMPRMSGYEVCQRIREMYLPSELPIIMVTAKNQLQDLVQGLSLGANDYLPKPFHKEELLARIQTQLDLHNIFEVAGRFVPNEFIKSINRERITDVKLGDYKEREVTVLFSDIRDYTSLSENMTPEENFGFVNAFHRRMGPIIRKHQGFVNQYLGDGIMAIFPNSPSHALQASMDMQRELQAYNQQRKAQNRKILAMGIGLHTGPLIMGIIGDHKRMDAATIADTVNTASRLESLTKYYGASILLSEDCLEKLDEKNAFLFRNLGRVQVKGKRKPIGICECFQGESDQQVRRKEQTSHLFEKGLQHFWAKEFPEASAVFNSLLKNNPEDSVAHHFLRKSSLYAYEGVPEQWDGVEKIENK